jgi:hypothetical protein
MTFSRSSCLGLLGGAALAAVVSIAPAQAQGAFSGLEGAWSGSGKILVSGGASENIRCRATYNVGSGGSTMNQVLRCASDSYRFDLTTNVTASGSNLSGNWTETSRNVNGTLNGRLTGGEVDALVEANGFSATFNMITKANKQTIAIRSQNTDLRGVDITLSK